VGIWEARSASVPVAVSSFHGFKIMDVRPLEPQDAKTVLDFRNPRMILLENELAP